ncbi:hypothetical protein M5K25_002204 [Dendrobium thyrsiflorum]|uniref:Uncharacterized protein n=1 Tax=Dendrobium thyrsiflorum TaxID=117978 RepID=A0ABD0VSV0_DENTH
MKLMLILIKNTIYIRCSCSAVWLSFYTGFDGEVDEDLSCQDMTWRVLIDILTATNDRTVSTFHNTYARERSKKNLLEGTQSIPKIAFKPPQSSKDRKPASEWKNGYGSRVESQDAIATSVVSHFKNLLGIVKNKSSIKFSKLNVDGSVSNMKASYGGIVRDYQGNMNFSFASCLPICKVFSFSYFALFSDFLASLVFGFWLPFSLGSWACFSVLGCSTSLVLGLLLLVQDAALVLSIFHGV